MVEGDAHRLQRGGGILGAVGPGRRDRPGQVADPSRQIVDRPPGLQAVLVKPRTREPVRRGDHLEGFDLGRREADFAQDVGVEILDVSRIVDDAVARTVGVVIAGDDGGIGLAQQIGRQPTLRMVLHVLHDAIDVRLEGRAGPDSRGRDEAVKILAAEADGVAHPHLAAARTAADEAADLRPVVIALGDLLRDDRRAAHAAPLKVHQLCRIVLEAEVCRTLRAGARIRAGAAAP